MAVGIEQVRDDDSAFQLPFAGQLLDTLNTGILHRLQHLSAYDPQVLFTIPLVVTTHVPIDRLNWRRRVKILKQSRQSFQSAECAIARNILPCASEFKSGGA